MNLLKSFGSQKVQLLLKKLKNEDFEDAISQPIRHSFSLLFSESSVNLLKNCSSRQDPFPEAVPMRAMLSDGAMSDNYIGHLLSGVEALENPRTPNGDRKVWGSQQRVAFGELRVFS